MFQVDYMDPISQRAGRVLDKLRGCGRRNEAELAYLTGLTRGQLQTALRRLAAAGVAVKEDGMWSEV